MTDTYILFDLVFGIIFDTITVCVMIITIIASKRK